MANQPQTDPALYTFTPLPKQQASRWIRVIEILPGSSDSDDCEDVTLTSNMLVANLEDNPTYTALSYVWGVDVKPRKILCAGSVIHITENCYSALLHLRRKLGTFKIWVDAICINQDDEEEKRQQIVMMEEIYSRATTVYLWLGEGNDCSTRAMSYLERAGHFEFYFPKGFSVNEAGVPQPRIWHAVWYLTASFWTTKTQAFLVRDWEILPRLISYIVAQLSMKHDPERKYVTHHDLLDLTNREWITRMWTFQEVIFASNPVVVCGDRQISWSRFAWSISFLACVTLSDGGDVSRNLSLKTWNKLVTTRARLANGHSKGSQNGQQISERPTSSDLVHYHEFLSNVLRRCMTIDLILFILESFCLIAIIIIPVTMFADSGQSGEGTATRTGSLVAIAILATLFVSFFLLTIPKWFMFSYKIADPEDSYELLRMDLLNAITSRKAEEPRDKAFAIQSVLQRFLDQKSFDSDYNRPLGDIYRSLCEQIMQENGPPYILIPAALHNCEGQPSWVPDWSKEIPEHWTDQVGVMDYERLEKKPDTNKAPAWRRDSDRPQILTIRGRQLGEISSCFKFQYVEGGSIETETPAHLANLEGTLGFARSCMTTNQLENHVLYFRKQHDYATKDSLPSLHQLKSWVKFLRLYRHVSPENVLSAMRSEKTNLTLHTVALCHLRVSVTDLVKTHIRMCNLFAETEVGFFVCKEFETSSKTKHVTDKGKVPVSTDTAIPKQSSISGRAHKIHRGICSDKVSVNDRVIFISGLPSMLIVRPQQGGECIQLVSPAVVSRLRHKLDPEFHTTFYITGDEIEFNVC